MEEHDKWLEQPIYTLTRKQAHLVMCLVELIDGAETYIAELQDKIGITGKEGYPESEWAEIDNADKHDQIRHSIERWNLHDALSIASSGSSSNPNNGLTVLDGGCARGENE